MNKHKAIPQRLYDRWRSRPQNGRYYMDGTVDFSPLNWYDG